MKTAGKCILVMLVITALSLPLPTNAPIFADSGTSGDISALQESQTVEVTLLGPNQYIRISGQPNVHADAFPGVEGTGRLIVENGHESGESRVSSAVVTVNEIPVLSPKDFNLEVRRLETTIDLHELNEITIELRSTEESFVTVSIVQEVEAEAATVIGPDGGVVEVTDPGSPIYGAKIAIPDGALPSDDVIIIGHVPQEVVDAASPQYGTIYATAQFLPEGLSFDGEATAELPLAVSYPPGTQLPIYLLESATNQFAQTGNLGNVTADGTSVVINLPHFSVYAVGSSLIKDYTTDEQGRFDCDICQDNNEIQIQLLSEDQTGFQTKSFASGMNVTVISDEARGVTIISDDNSTGYPIWATSIPDYDLASTNIVDIPAMTAVSYSDISALIVDQLEVLPVERPGRVTRTAGTVVEVLGVLSDAATVVQLALGPVTWTMLLTAVVGHAAISALDELIPDEIESHQFVAFINSAHLPH